MPRVILCIGQGTYDGGYIVHGSGDMPSYIVHGSGDTHIYIYIVHWFRGIPRVILYMGL